jgi:hypothetical protein
MAYPTSVTGAWPGNSEAEFDNYVGLFKEAYSDMIRLKAQTTESVLSDTLMPEQLQGDPLNLDSYKGVTLTQRSRGRQFGVNTGASGPDAAVGDQEYSQTPVERRTVVPQFWEYAELFDPRDERALMRAVRPDGQYAQNVVAAFNRKKDDVILAALIGDSTINGTAYASEDTTLARSMLHGFRRDTSLAFGGSGGDLAAGSGSAVSTIATSWDDTDFDETGNGVAGTNGAVLNALAAGTFAGLQQVLAHDFAALAAATTDTALHVNKLIAAQEVLQSNGMNAGTRVHCVLHPEQVGQLMSELQYTSADYNALRPLQTGQPVDFMGMSFRVSNRIVEEQVLGTVTLHNTTGIATLAGKYVYCYTEDVGVFGMTDDVTVRFDEIPERGYSLQCYHNFGLGGARMDPKKIVIIPCT